MTYTNFKLAIDGDGIALLTWDVPDRSMNVITLQGIEELSAIVEELAADAAIKGVVITSAKEAFCAGAGKQPDFDFRQAEPRLRILRRDAVVAGERQFEAAAHGGAVEGRDPGLAAGLDAPIEQR